MKKNILAIGWSACGVKKIISAIFLLAVFLLPMANVYASSNTAVCGGITIGGFTFQYDSGCNVSGGSFNSGTLNQYGLPSGSVSGIISTIMTWFLGMLGIFGILGFLVSGSMYLLAAGDADLLKRAKLVMTSSIIGIIVGMLGLIAVNVIFSILNADPSNI